MNKKLLTAFIAVALSTTILPMSKAEEVKPATLAIIDTALNSNMPEIKNNIIYEACVIEWNSCPNKTGLQEGFGSALLPVNQISSNGFEHGTQMVSAAIQTNPNIKIVFIRFVGATYNGTRQITTENGFIKALDWVITNKTKLNIRAVAMSQGHHNLFSSVNYCPKTLLTESRIISLNALDVPVFLAAGNTRDLSRIDWPSCIPTAIAVSAATYGDGPAIYTNYDPFLTDIFARGDMQLLSSTGIKSNQVGTSISTQVAGAAYIALANKYPTYTSKQLLDLLNTKTVPLVSKTIKAKLIDVTAVLNG